LVGNFKLNSHKIQNDMLESNTTRGINRYTWDFQVSDKITSFRYTTLIQSTGMIQAQAQPVRKGAHMLFL